MDMDVAGEFIVMAAELMAIKAKMLLPRDKENQEDPRKELADALLLLQQAKEAAEELKPLYEEYSGRMVKDNDEVPPEKGFPLGLDRALVLVLAEPGQVEFFLFRLRRLLWFHIRIHSRFRRWTVDNRD